MLELYHHGSSVCAAKARIALFEKDIPWTGHYLDILKGDQFDPEYRKLNPKGVVPTLVHDGNVVLESTVICEYLDDMFPGPRLKPADPLAQAHMRLWTKRVDEEVHPSVRPVTYVTTHRHSIMRKSEEEVEEHINSDPDPVWRERKRGWIRQGLDAPDVQNAILTFDCLLKDMNEALATRKWLIGDDYTLADTGLTPYANRLNMLGFSEMWSDLPHFARWFEAVRERPSFKPALFDYLPEDLRSRMVEDGKRAWPNFKRMLASA